MKFLRSLQLGLLHRRTLKTLVAIDARLAEQNSYLKRLADHFAPSYATHEPTVAQAGVDFLNVNEAVIVNDFVDRTQREQGRPPTDDEILQYLADHATVSLAERMESQI